MSPVTTDETTVHVFGFIGHCVTNVFNIVDDAVSAMAVGVRTQFYGRHLQQHSHVIAKLLLRALPSLPSGGQFDLHDGAIHYVLKNAGIGSSQSKIKDAFDIISFGPSCERQCGADLSRKDQLATCFHCVG